MNKFLLENIRIVIRNKYLYYKRTPYYLFFFITILSFFSCNYNEKKHSNNKETILHNTLRNVNIDSLIKINQYKNLFLDLYSGMNREIFDLVINKLVTEGKLRDFGF